MRVAIPPHMPAEEISTKCTWPRQELLKSGDQAASTSAAHVDSAKEPKRPAPKPAMPPTLTPTLSLQQAGLR